MTKSLFLLSIFYIFSGCLNGCAQNNPPYITPQNNSASSVNCYYGKSITMGYYSSEYNQINADSLKIIQGRLEAYLKMILGTYHASYSAIGRMVRPV